MDDKQKEKLMGFGKRCGGGEDQVQVPVPGEGRGLKTAQEIAAETSTLPFQAPEGAKSTGGRGEGGADAQIHTGNKHVDQAVAAAQSMEASLPLMPRIENPEQFAESFSWEALAVAHLQGKSRLDYHRVEAKRMFDDKLVEFEKQAKRPMTPAEKGTLAVMLHAIAEQEQIMFYQNLGVQAPAFPAPPQGKQFEKPDYHPPEK